ncbi:MAG: molybdopterin synthase subunit MoaD [Chloroflexi bacterium]|nr:molybdopterin synthase subunit MoaD [Chloroflexota bacterium]
MSVDVRVPTVLRKHTDGERVVKAEGSTVAAVIEDLERVYPGLQGELRGDDGALRQFVNIYVNDEDIRYLNRLDTQINPGDELAILPAVAGGGGG